MRATLDQAIAQLYMINRRVAKGDMHSGIKANLAACLANFEKIRIAQDRVTANLESLHRAGLVEIGPALEELTGDKYA